MNVLFDTNAYTALLRGEPELVQHLDRVGRILMSSTVVGELEYGFRHGNRYDQNRALLDDFLSEPSVEFITITRDTTVRYGILAADLQRKGRKIPTNDAWIASHALEHNAELWTCDRHFDEVDGLLLHRWS